MRLLLVHVKEAGGTVQKCGLKDWGGGQHGGCWSSMTPFLYVGGDLVKTEFIVKSDAKVFKTFHHLKLLLIDK